jgi:hypothetical protein
MHREATVTAIAETEEARRFRQRASRWLTTSWWIVTPAFAVLAIETLYERAVQGAAEPWLWMTGRPGLALAVGCLYVAAHWWCPAWYFLVVRPGTAGRALYDQEHAFKAVCLLALLAFDYSPVSLWRSVAGYLSIR